MFSLDYFLTWPIIVIGTVASLGYGLFAINIFFKKDKVEETKNEHISWKIHQFWLNFLGSFLGWLILYFLLKRVEFVKSNNYLYSLSFRDVISVFFAFIGITGYLPMTIVGLVNSISSLAQKIIEVLSKTFIK